MSAYMDQASAYPSLERIFRAHLDNSLLCSQILYELFANLDAPESYIAKIKQLEEQGDRLTGEAYFLLQSAPFSGLTSMTQELIKLLDDIVDGFNKTAKLIDICQPRHIEGAAYDILSVQKGMLERLQQEINRYPNNDPSSLRTCCSELKQEEEQVDIIYHEWRKKERRILELSLIDESNWTEIFGVLEQTTDDIYHAAIVLESITRYRSREMQ